MLRDVLGDPPLELLLLPAREPGCTSTRTARPCRAASRDGRARASPIERGGAAARVVVHDRRPTSTGRRCGGRRGRRAGHRDRAAARRAAPPAHGGRGLPRADRRRRPTRSAAASSATCTTARSSGWSRSGSRCATPSTSSATAARSGRAGRWTAPSARSRPRSTSCASSRRGLPPSQLDAGLAAALRELAARAPMPVERRRAGERFERGVEAAAYFIACEGLTNAVEARARDRASMLRGRAANGQLVVRVADDGVGGAAAAAGSGLRRPRRPRRRARRHARDRERAGAGTTLVAELPCGS